MSHFNYNNGTLYYEAVGTGEPILFVHGFSLDHRMWEPQTTYLKDHYQTITYDMRGFGKSSLPVGEYSHHEDMKALLDYLEIESVHLVGLSLGGEMSIDFAITYTNQVKSLTVIDSSLGGFHCKVNWGDTIDLGLKQIKRNWLNHEVFKPSCRDEGVKQQLAQFVDDYSGWHWLHHDPRTKVLPSAMERLGEIIAPTQIIVGADDLDNYHHIAKIIHEKVKNSTVKILPDTGHMANLERPEEVNGLIEKLLKIHSNRRN